MYNFLRLMCGVAVDKLLDSISPMDSNWIRRQLIIREHND